MAVSEVEQQDKAQEQEFYIVPSDEFQEHKTEVVDKRLSSLESLSVVSALIAGFAVNDAASFDASNYAWPWMYVYAFSIAAVIVIMMYVSLITVLTSVGTKRIAAWDDTFRFKRPSAAEIFKNQNYAKVMKMIAKDQSDWTYTIEKHSTQGGTVAKDASGKQRVLRMPLQCEFFKYMADGPHSPINLGISLLPISIVLYFLAIIMNFSKGNDSGALLAIMIAFFGPVGVYMGHIMNKLVHLMIS